MSLAINREMRAEMWYQDAEQGVEQYCLFLTLLRQSLQAAMGMATAQK
jgi:hypothetical protein